MNSDDTKRCAKCWQYLPEHSRTMREGIVEALLKWADWNDGKSSVSPIKDPFADSLSQTMRDAADEIERLRAAVSQRDCCEWDCPKCGAHIYSKVLDQ